MVQIKVGDKFVTAQGTRPYLTSVKACGLAFESEAIAKAMIGTLAHELKISADELSVVNDK